MALLQEEFTSLSDDVDLDRDRALVERCQAGDSGAFGNLYARYYERLLRFCQRRLNDRHEAEDAAQEAFARAWKALPNFAGERRFYPWLTVIAGNICTDMLRRRSRSTPTDDFELSSQQPIGGGAIESSEEFIIAAVDGELVNKALGRLSVRHRHVLAMREGSGWTYQQIADHEGVEIGTIETLLWRARQALKREFNVLSETKGALAGFLAGAGALVRRGLLRAANRVASLPQSGGGAMRNAVAGVAVTSAAVAAAIIAPHAFTAPGTSGQVAQSAPAAAAVASPFLPLTGGHSALGGSGSTKGASKTVAPTAASTSDSTTTPLSGTLGPASGPLSASPAFPVSPSSGFSLFPTAPSPQSPPNSTAPTTAGSGLGSAASGLLKGVSSPGSNGTAGLSDPITGLGDTITSLTGGSLGSGSSLPGLGTTSTSGTGDAGSSGSGGTSTGTTAPVTVPPLSTITGGLSTTVTTLGTTLLGQG